MIYCEMRFNVEQQVITSSANLQQERLVTSQPLVDVLGGPHRSVVQLQYNVTLLYPATKKKERIYLVCVRFLKFNRGPELSCKTFIWHT